MECAFCVCGLTPPSDDFQQKEIISLVAKEMGQRLGFRQVSITCQCFANTEEITAVCKEVAGQKAAKGIYVSIHIVGSWKG
jgi:hypothetical protein